MTARQILPPLRQKEQHRLRGINAAPTARRHLVPQMMSSALKIVVVALALLVGAIHAHAGSTSAGQQSAGGVTLTVFWTSSCPHCAKARAFVARMASRESRLKPRSIELAGDGAAERSFQSVVRHFRIDPPAVPVVIVGDEAFIGYDDDETTGAAISAKIAACLSAGCEDTAGSIIEGRGSAPPGRAHRPRSGLPGTVTVPILGEIDTRALSLPALTVVLGAVDGFNPCAMWVLVFLIGLLVGMSDPLRMWTYGAVFIATSALVYFAFMAAWLNLFLFLGSLAWIRILVGVFALAAAAYYLREFATNTEGACKVTSPGQRQGIMSRMRALIAEKSFVLAILGIVVLAVAVNMIELVCSAGIPAVYTQVLALSDLSRAAYYGYLALYIGVFMLDDAAVFVTAMVTLRATGLATTYARYSHLIGGIAMAAIGLMLLFRPEWLAFA